jgi:probable F420-dependent oxidoreductase
LNFEPWDLLIDHAVLAERLGFEGVVLPDHVVIPTGEVTPHPTGYPLIADEPYAEPLIAFAAMSARTTRLRFLTGVLVVPQRDPLLLAKQLGTLALLSGNRVVLGSGVGWLQEEFDMIGQDFASRGARMDEILELMTDFWLDGYAELDGRHYLIPHSAMFPPPRQSIPIWLGAVSQAGRRRASRYQGYIPMRLYDNVSRQEFAEVDALRAELGMDGDFERVAFWPGGDRDTADQMAKEGVTSIVVQPWPEHSTAPVKEKHALLESFAASMFAA